MRILVIGSGGREHAICWALRTTAVEPVQIFCAPGNAGIAEIAERVRIKADDLAELASFAESAKIDLTVVGPEAPLAAGIVDEFERRDLKVVGPCRKAARLEASKAYAKDFMRRHHIPTAVYRIASSPEEAIQILQSGEIGDQDAAVVVKADGLAAGKGVVVAPCRKDAIDAVRDLTSGTLAPGAANQIVIEEPLSGPELSLLLFTDGENFRLMPAARDHKRVGENDTGPNTGGMGSVTDEGILNQRLREQIVREVVEPTLRGAQTEALAFRGILFIGLMLTRKGPRVLEYNVRFGDPETQAILIRLRTDLSKIFMAIAERRLGEIEIEWLSGSSACVVLASKGYPGKPEVGARIDGLDRAQHHNRVALFHAATERDAQGGWLTAGGRVLGVSATGESLRGALNSCYEAISEINWPGLHYRRDIGRDANVSGPAG